MKVLVALASLAGVQAATEQELRFIACPVYRDADAGRKSGCWLADDQATGTRYDVTPSTAKPDWNFAILVEGKVATAQDNACGGTVLLPVRTSVLEMPCTRHTLPAEGFPGRKFVLPRRNVDPLSVPRATPQPPIADRTFRFYFDWNSDFLAYQREDWSLDQAITWIRGVKVKHITITGYAATRIEIVSGQRMSERSTLSSQRAVHVAEALYRLGVSKDRMTTVDGGTGDVIADDWVDGLASPSQRRVEVAVEVER